MALCTEMRMQLINYHIYKLIYLNYRIEERSFSLILTDASSLTLLKDTSI